MLSHFIFIMILISMNHYPPLTGEKLSFKGIKQLACGYTMMELEFKPRFFYSKFMFLFKLLSKWLNAHITRNVDVANLKYVFRAICFSPAQCPLLLFVGEKYVWGAGPCHYSNAVNSYFTPSKLSFKFLFSSRLTKLLINNVT